MKRALSVSSVPLALALALVLAGVALPVKSSKQRREQVAVRSYRSGRLANGIAPSSVLLTPVSLSEDEQEFARMVNEEAAPWPHPLTVDPVLTRRHGTQPQDVRARLFRPLLAGAQAALAD